MSKAKQHILVTRPEPQGRVLCQLIKQHGMEATLAPLFSYQQSFIAQKSPQADIVLFVSTAAVEFAHQQVPLNLWRVKQFIAVGQATQNALHKYGITAIAPKKQNSEGVLALSALAQVKNQQIIIVRGDDGRELLFDSLKSAGAKVCYMQSYQRLWRTFPKQINNQWYQSGVNFIICTSVAMLEKMAKLLLSTDNYWQVSCTWVVASPRIYKKAQQLELCHIILANGASNQDLLAACQNGSNL